jgi:tetratricopeptide (TPR) repeat protein
MDRKAFVEKLKARQKKLLFAVAGIAVCGVGAGVWVKVAPRYTHSGEKFFASASDEVFHGGPVGSVRHAIESINDKVEAIETAEEENEKLKLENANLRMAVEGLRFDCGATDAKKRTEQLQLTLEKDTGTHVGRTLASISYRPPTHLTPAQLYTLAVSYFRAGEDEKAAVILTFLTDMEDASHAFRTSKNYVMTGVAWYHLDNYQLADQYFEQALKTNEGGEAVRYQAQARLWKALVSQKAGKKMKAQFWLRELVDHHPHSPEASWVNGGGVSEEAEAAAEEGIKEEGHERAPAGE